MTPLRRFMCRRGLHLWSKPRVRQLPGTRIVTRECWFCETSRSMVQDVWSEPVRDSRPPVEWCDAIRQEARPGGAA